MAPLRPKKGRLLQYDAPVWEPLFQLAPEHVGEFMWMNEIELEDGTRLHAYKHRHTRRYLHLDHGGRAFFYIPPDDFEGGEPSQYRETNPHWQLELSLGRPEERASLIRQNISAEFKRIRWARSATKHRISKKRIRDALERCLAILELDSPTALTSSEEVRLVFLGEDASGDPLEVIAVKTDRESLMVIHAMRLRPRYRSTYEEVRRCNR